MNCIENEVNTQIEVKKSKFISFALPAESFKDKLKELKQAHPKASHIVWAYRVLNSYGQIEENSSDDGEPKGAAGVPTLNVLRGAKLINCAIITVRYFGGIKLGVGGMARAYSSSANEVLKKAPIKPYINLIECKYRIDYTKQRRFEYLLKELHISNVERIFLTDAVEYILRVTQEQKKVLKSSNYDCVKLNLQLLE